MAPDDGRARDDRALPGTFRIALGDTAKGGYIIHFARAASPTDTTRTTRTLEEYEYRLGITISRDRTSVRVELGRPDEKLALLAWLVTIFRPERLNLAVAWHGAHSFKLMVRGKRGDVTDTLWAIAATFNGLPGVVEAKPEGGGCLVRVDRTWPKHDGERVMGLLRDPALADLFDLSNSL